MRTLVRLLDRFMPALLMAASVTLLSAGLMSYAPSTFGDSHTPEPTLGGGDPLFGQATSTPDPTPTAAPATPAVPPTVIRSATPSLATGSPTPSPSSSPTATLTPASAGIASRIRIPSLDVDLPIVAGDLDMPGNRNDFPLCDVAMYLPGFVQPGDPGTTYIYAHAQRGMFLPLLRASQVRDGASMLGALVEVFSSDGRLHLYEIERVKRHATDLSLTQIPAGEHQLVLQTSEGPTGTIPKLQVAARPIAVVPAEAGEANPRPRPRVCLPG